MAHPDFDEMLNVMVPFAQDMLAKHGEFYPFAASVDPKGEVACVAGVTGDEEHPDSQEIIDFLIHAFRAEAKRSAIRAAGICFDSRVVPPGEKEKTDAICVRFEHSDGDVVKVFLPYHKGRLGRYKYGELFAVEEDRAIFGQD